MANSLNTITVDGVTYNSQAYADSQVKTVTNQKMDKEAFLKLLVTELQFQDPLEPKDNSEFVAEMAQFTTVEQLTNLSDSMKEINTLLGNIDTSVLVGQLSSMIGKGVDWIQTTNEADEEGNPITTTENFSGVITGVTVAEGVTKVITEDVNGGTHQVEIGNIAYVYETGSNVKSSVNN